VPHHLDSLLIGSDDGVSLLLHVFPDGPITCPIAIILGLFKNAPITLESYVLSDLDVLLSSLELLELLVKIVNQVF